MSAKKRNMWATIKLVAGIVTGLSAIVTGFATYKEKEQAKIDNSEKNQKTEDFRDNQTVKINNVEDAVLKFESALGLKENAREILELLLGKDYEKLIQDKETFDQLADQFKDGNVNQIIEENKHLKDLIENNSDLKNNEFKGMVITLIESYKYKSARILIEKYIKDNKDMKPDFLAQLYVFLGSTYSFGESNLLKKREYISKAAKLAPNNVNILRHYGKHLNSTFEHKKAVRVLDKAVKLIENGNEIEAWENMFLLITLANSHIQVEMDKPKEEQDFTKPRKYLKKAIEYNSKEKSNYSKLFIIYRDLSKIEIATNNYDKAIELLYQSIEIETKIDMKALMNSNTPVTEQGSFSMHTAQAFLNLGNCFTQRIKSQKNPETFPADYKKAQFAYTNSLAIYYEFVGPNHIHIADVLNNFGNLEISGGQHDLALHYYKESLRLTESYEILFPRKLAICHGNLSIAYAQVATRDDALAIDHGEKALSLYRGYLPENHVNIIRVKETIKFTKDRRKNIK